MRRRWEPLALSYRAHAAWLSQELEGGRQVAYWRRHLAGAPRALTLPTDRPRPPAQDSNGATLSRQVATEVVQRLGELRQREGVTSFMLIMSALSVVLSRWSGQRDVVVGAPIAGRTPPGSDALVGLFVNVLPLRTTVDPAQPFVELLAGVKAATLDGFAQQQLPFERLVDELDVERDLSVTPVFQVALNMLSQPEARWRLAGLRAEPLGWADASAKWDISFYAAERDGKLVLHVVYATALFDEERIAALAAQIEGVLSQASADPTLPIASLELAAADRAPALTRRTYPQVLARIAHHVAVAPHARAVGDPAQVWSYLELWRRAGGVQRALMDAGITRGDRVAVWCRRDAMLVAALLGIWRAGAAFIVLSPHDPAARIAEQLETARPKLLLSAAEGTPSFAQTLVLSGEADHVDSRVESGAETLAYVAFTSGSTGRPKAVEGEHGPLAHFFDWYAHELALDEGDTFSALSGLGHDPLLRDLFAPLYAGASLVLPPERVLEQAGALATWCADSAISIMHLTPSMAQLLIGSHDRVTVAGLRAIVLGGEAADARDGGRYA